MIPQKIFASILAILVSSLCAQSAARDPVLVRELLMLLRAGVPSAEIVLTLKRRGDPPVVSQADLEALQEAGADQALQARLTARLETFRRLEDLAREFDVHSDLEFGLDLLVPKKPTPWLVEVTRVEESLFVQIAPEEKGAKGWFQRPEVYLWVTPGTHFPSGATPAIAERLGRIMRRLLDREGLSPGLLRSMVRDFARGLGREVQMSATQADTGFRGQVSIRTRVLKNGAVLVAALVVSAADAAKIEPLFDEMARSIEWSRRVAIR